MSEACAGLLGARHSLFHALGVLIQAVLMEDQLRCRAFAVADEGDLGIDDSQKIVAIAFG
jgi:hypothetical protein